MIDTLILTALGISDYFFASLPATFDVMIFYLILRLQVNG